MKTTSVLRNSPAALAFLIAALLTLWASSVYAMDLPTVLTWSDDPRTSMTISWWRDASGTGMVEFGASGITNVAMESCATNAHRIVLTNLLANAAYWYRTTSSDTDAWSAAEWFRTAPDKRAPVQLGVLGDTRSNHEAGVNFDATHQAVADAMSSHWPHVWLNVGDLVENGTTLFDWEHFLAIERLSLARSPYAPVIGSHDLRDNRDTSLYWTYFATPGAAGKVGHWSFDVGNVHVVMLNSEEDIAGQTPWLEADFAAATTNPAINWLAAVFHQPAYGAAPERINWQIVAEWCPLFERYAVDFVFSGHNHVYHRSTPINGVRYILSGGGGAELHPATITGITAYGTSCYEFVILSFSNQFATSEAFGTNDGMFDSCIVTNTPVVIVTNADIQVSNNVTSTALGGTSAKTSGILWWTNSLNGATGSLQVSSFKFHVSTIPLSVGTNIIAVSGTNAWGVMASDSASVIRDAAPEPQIASNALVFPASGSQLRAGSTTNILWDPGQITDADDGTNLVIASISLLYAATTSQVAVLTNDVDNVAGSTPWQIGTNLMAPGVDYVLQFEVVDSSGLTNRHIFASQPFNIVPEAGTLGLFSLFCAGVARKAARRGMSRSVRWSTRWEETRRQCSNCPLST